MVYIFSHFYRPTVFPLTHKNYWYSKLISLLFPLFFLMKERKKERIKPAAVCQRAEFSLCTSYPAPTWPGFVLLISLHVLKKRHHEGPPPPCLLWNPLFEEKLGVLGSRGPGSGRGRRGRPG